MGSYAYYQAQAQQEATLTHIAALETCLAASNQQRAQAAKNTVLTISEAVRKNHNQAADMAVLRQTQQIQDSTQALLANLHRLRQSWQRADSQLEMQMLPVQIERYVSSIRRFVSETPPLTKPATQTVRVGWLGEFDTATEPKPAALAQLTKLETQVRQMEAEALTSQSMKVVFEYVFDKIGAFAAPASATVAPGAVYQAQLTLVQSVTNERVRFSAEGREIALDPTTGQGRVQFSVPAARPGQPDTVRAQWQGRVQLPWASADTTLEITVPYFIVTPRSH